MRVLMQSRVSLYTVPGGDTVQITQTKAALEAKGIHVDLSLELEPDLSSYDLVHLFNFTRIQETYIQALNAKRQNKPVVLSTIYWPFDEFEHQGQRGWRAAFNRCLSVNEIEYLKGIWRFLRDGERNQATRALLARGYRGLQHATLPMIDFFLPNSEIEMQAYCKDFGLELEATRYQVVVNGVDLRFGAPPTVEADEIPEGGILCVARIETRKNQLALLRAAKGLGVPLVFVGGCAPNHAAYLQELRAEADDSVIFAGRVEHDRLPAVYRRARVHALVSWFETPGLSSLEAGIAGCNLVVSDRGSTREYFGDHAQYCDPNSVSSIRSALEQALVTPPSSRLAERIRRDYSWDSAAMQTLTAYQRVTGQPVLTPSFSQLDQT